MPTGTNAERVPRITRAKYDYHSLYASMCNYLHTTTIDGRQDYHVNDTLFIVYEPVTDAFLMYLKGTHVATVDSNNIFVAQSDSCAFHSSFMSTVCYYFPLIRIRGFGYQHLTLRDGKTIFKPGIRFDVYGMPKSRLP